MDLGRPPPVINRCHGQILAVEDAVAASPDAFERCAFFVIDDDAVVLQFQRAASGIDISLADGLEQRVAGNFKRFAGAIDLAVLDDCLLADNGRQPAGFLFHFHRHGIVADDYALGLGQFLLEGAAPISACERR